VATPEGQDPTKAQPAPRDDQTGDEADTPRTSDRAPLGGDETTQNQLVADNPAEEATLAALDPESPPA